MKLLNESQILLQWSDLDTWRQRPLVVSPRSSGTHLSGVIRYVLQSLKKLDADDETDEMPVVVGAGLAWESWIVGLHGYQEMIWQPGEWEVDGVYGTPDGLWGPGGHDTRYERPCDQFMLEEFKYTLKSEWSKGKDGLILSQSIWMWQLAANCYALSQLLDCLVTLARLTVYWACGNYRPPSPMLKRYLIEFEEKELADIWRNVILRNKDAEGVVRERH